jgi:hypothetical protein
MLSFTPTPLLAPTDSDPDLPPLRSESARYRSQQPSSPSIRSPTTLLTRSATANFDCPRARAAVSTLHRRNPISIHPPRSNENDRQSCVNRNGWP